MKMRVSLLAAALVLGKMTFGQVEDGKRFMYYQRYQSAKDAFQKALASKPNDGETTYWLGQAEFGLKDSASAKDLYQKAIQANPNDPWLLVGIGESELKDNNTADARNRFEMAITLTKGKDANILHAVARANINTVHGDYQYAIAKLNQAIAVERKHVEAALYVTLGDAYARMIDGGNAVTNYQNALQADPKFAEAHYKIGLIYETQKNPTQYYPEFEAAIAADPNYAPAYYRLYVDYYYMDVEKSKDYLNQYIAHADAGPIVDEASADILFAAQHYQEAIDRAKALLPAAPDAYKPHYYKLMAYSYGFLKNYADAKTDIDTYLAHPDDSLAPRNYDVAALIYFRGHYNEDSIYSFLRKAIAMDTVEANREAYVARAQNIADSLGDPAAKAYWAGVVYKMDKDPNPNDLYNWGSEVFNAADAIRAKDSARTGISDAWYNRADSVFTLYADKFPAFSVYAYYWKARSQWALDTDFSKGAAIPDFQKMIQVADTSRDSTKFVDQIKIGYQYLINYYFKKKDYKNTLEYINKYLVYDPGNEQFKHLKEALERYLNRQQNGGAKTGK